VNDTTWRKLSAILGVACVVLIIAAGALLATSGESPAPSASLSDTAIGSVAPSASGDSTASAPVTSASPLGSPTPIPSATAVVKAPIAQVTFNNVTLDASTDALGKPRTFTFVTDGSGPVGISITKSAPAKATTRICAKVDDSKPDCRTGTKVVYKGAFTDTAHSVWVVTMIGPASTGPTVDIAFSWPTNHASITLTHGRLQGSNVSDPLDGFMATVRTVAAGNLTVAASWTAITTNVKITTEDLTGTATIVDEKQFTATTNLGTPGYTFAVGAARSYRITFKNQLPDSGRPDLTAVISVP
jgi:hypothetical protein